MRIYAYVLYIHIGLRPQPGLPVGVAAREHGGLRRLPTDTLLRRQPTHEGLGPAVRGRGSPNPNPNPNPTPSPNPNPNQVATAITIVLTVWRVVLPAYLLPAEGRYCHTCYVTERRSNPNPNPNAHPHPNPHPNPNTCYVTGAPFEPSP